LQVHDYSEQQSSLQQIPAIQPQKKQKKKKKKPEKKMKKKTPVQYCCYSASAAATSASRDRSSHGPLHKWQRTREGRNRRKTKAQQQQRQQREEKGSFKACARERERERERDKRAGFWLALLFVCTFCVCGVKFRFITGEHFPIVFKYFRVSFSFGV
jgi:hypothetical protein